MNGRHLGALAAFHQVYDQRRAFRQVVDVRKLDDRARQEGVRRSVGGLHKAETTVRIEPLHGHFNFGTNHGGLAERVVPRRLTAAAHEVTTTPTTYHTPGHSPPGRPNEYQGPTHIALLASACKHFRHPTRKILAPAPPVC
jgi:hypothetical protein